MEAHPEMALFSPSIPMEAGLQCCLIPGLLLVAATSRVVQQMLFMPMAHERLIMAYCMGCQARHNRVMEMFSLCIPMEADILLYGNSINTRLQVEAHKVML